jgi:molybdopterin converting factor small subunit
LKVRVIVHGHAREYFPDPREEFDFEFAPGDTVADMLATLGIRTELVMRVVAGDGPASKSHALADGETIILFTPVAGG